MIKNIAVFCGSSEGFNEIYRETAWQTGEYLAEKNIGIIYGGGKIGLMGALADGVIEKAGTITGVIPAFLQRREIVHEGISDLVIVETMHERKLKMYELCDAVITLPGGLGTMEEMFEILTWAQLGLHQKPMGLLNINGYYDSLKALLNTMVQEGFLNESYGNMLLVSESLEELLTMMETYQAPEIPTILNTEMT